MCGTCDTAEALAVVAEAHRVASSLAAELLGEPVAKAMDLGTARGFDRAVASLAAELRRQAGRSERDAVRAAVDVLDVDGVMTALVSATVVDGTVIVATCSGPENPHRGTFCDAYVAGFVPGAP